MEEGVLLGLSLRRVQEIDDRASGWIPRQLDPASENFGGHHLAGIARLSPGMTIEAATGPETLEKVRDEDPDAVLLDIKMPRMDGMELLRKVRQQSDMPVIFLTSKDDEIDELFGLKMGADENPQLKGLIEKILAAAPEYERITAFQAQYPFAFTRQAYQDLVDILLRNSVFGTGLAGINFFCVGFAFDPNPINFDHGKLIRHALGCRICNQYAAIILTGQALKARR